MNLKNLRHRANLGTYQVAQELRVAESSVRNWETGRTTPKMRIDQFYHLCELYGCSFDELHQAFLETEKQSKSRRSGTPKDRLRLDKQPQSSKTLYQTRPVTSIRELEDVSSLEELKFLYFTTGKLLEVTDPSEAPYTVKLLEMLVKEAERGDANVYSEYKSLIDEVFSAHPQAHKLLRDRWMHTAEGGNYRKVYADILLALYEDGVRNFYKADISQQSFTKKCLRGIKLSGADLSWAILRYADLSGSDLFEAKLYKTNLTEANLEGADLSGATLTAASLRSANLSKARLIGTKLRLADLRNADLRGAEITYANLDRADLTGAKLDETSFKVIKADSALFGDNTGLSESQVRQLQHQGAIFETT